MAAEHEDEDEELTALHSRKYSLQGLAIVDVLRALTFEIFFSRFVFGEELIKYSP